MARQTPVLVKSFAGDTIVAANTVVVASGANAGNVKAARRGGRGGHYRRDAAGVRRQQLMGRLCVSGIAQCRILTGTAINFGDTVKIADTSGRVTKAVPVATGGANVRGQVGIAMQSLASTAATDTLIDVLLQPGIVVE